MSNFCPATLEGRHAKPWLVGQLSSAKTLLDSARTEKLRRSRLALEERPP
jgi:hypothetical protein